MPNGYHVELRQLQYFVAVAEELSFTRGAARLHISQPPVSRQVMLLEENLGVRLLERSKQFVRLTAAGEHFYREARAILASIASAVHSTQQVANGQIGRLTLGLGGTAAYILPDVLQKFRQLYPQVELVLSPLHLAYQHSALEAGKIDVGLVITPGVSSELNVQHLLRVRFHAVLPADHPLTGQDRVSLKDLAEENFVMVPYAKGRGFGRAIMEICRRAGFTPRIVQEAEPMEAVIGMVAAGAGVSIVPRWLEHLHVPKVAYRPIKEAYAGTSIGMAWRKDNASPLIQPLLSCCAASSRRG